MARAKQAVNVMRYKDAELPTDAAGLKALLTQTLTDFKALKDENESIKLDVNTKLGELNTKLSENPDFITPEALEEKLNELSDQMAKIKSFTQVAPEDQKQVLRSVAEKTWGGFVAQRKTGGVVNFQSYMQESNPTDHFKALNITNADEGGLAVAEVLSSDLIEYGREYSPILGEVGRKNGMTRNFRELVLVSYPSVAKGIENVPGTNFAETDTQTYKEVKSKEFKVYAKPRITDEARYGADRDLYGDLVRLLGREIGIYMAAQVLYGDGSDKVARGILSSQRVDITDVTGESFKPTLAADPADARNPDFYPVTPTGVTGALGTDDKAIVDLTIDVVNNHPTEFLAQSGWKMNRKTRGVFQKVRDAEDRPIFQTEFRDGVAVLTMQGYPVVIDDTLPDIAVDSTPIIFGRLDRAYAIARGDIDYMLLDPYTVDACTVLKYHLEMFEIMQNSDAIQIIACTTNGPA